MLNDELEGVITDLQSGLKQPNKIDIATLRRVQISIAAHLANVRSLVLALQDLKDHIHDQAGTISHLTNQLRIAEDIALETANKE